MAYCPNCGAYLPDGQTVCVACNTEINETAATQPAEIPQNNLTLDYKPAEKQSHSTSQNTGGTPTAEKTPENNLGADLFNSSSSKIFAALSYFSVLWLLPFLFAPNDPYAKFHAKQGIVLFVISLIVDALTAFKGIFAILYAARLYLIVVGVMNAVSGRMAKLPWIGQLADRF